MKLDIEKVVASLQQEADKLPSVEQWQPSFSGSIDIVIDEQMQWFHEGGVFQRQALVKLFSTILRKEGERYYLVTPAEKLAITVIDVPFKIIAMLEQNSTLYLISNTQERIALDADTHWQLRDYQGAKIPYVEVRNGLFARVDRNVYYQMVENAQQVEANGRATYMLASGSCLFPLE